VRIVITSVSYPDSKFKPTWIEGLKTELTKLGINVLHIERNAYYTPLDWRPNTFEIVIQEWFEAYFTVNHLKSSPTKSLTNKSFVSLISHHVIEIASIILSRRFRRMRMLSGRRNLDISNSYASFLEDGKIFASADWVLNLEDDALPRSNLAETAKKLQGIILNIGQESEKVWAVDLSASYSFAQMRISEAPKRDVSIARTQFSVFDGRTNNTMCAVMVPATLWVEYLRYLQSSIPSFGVRLIPCDWILNDFAKKFPGAYHRETWLTEEGLFIQGSLES
jgi:hypothetical protein